MNNMLTRVCFGAFPVGGSSYTLSQNKLHFSALCRGLHKFEWCCSHLTKPTEMKD